MIDKRLVGGGFIGGMLLGIAALDSAAVTDFMRGFMGMPRSPSELVNAEPQPQAFPEASPRAGEVAAAGLTNVDRPTDEQLSNLRQLIAISLLTRRSGGAPATNGIPSGPVRSYPSSDPSLALLQSMNTGSTGRPIPAEQIEPVFQSGSPLHFDTTAPTLPNIGALDVRTGQFLAPAGRGGYVDPRDGTFYAPSGQNGVVNTRTGEYSPVSH